MANFTSKFGHFKQCFNRFNDVNPTSADAACANDPSLFPIVAEVQQRTLQSHRLYAKGSYRVDEFLRLRHVLVRYMKSDEMTF
jgi:hypothetical protein